MNLLLVNGVLVEETSTLHHKIVSIFIEKDRIKEVAIEITDEKAKNAKIIDLEGAFISAGWIDMHVHCFQGDWSIGIDADRIGFESGVTTIVDAGSSGSDTINEFVDSVKDKKTKVRAMLNISRFGLKKKHELRNIEDIDVKSAIDKANEFSKIVVGFKLRASATVMGDDMETPFILAKRIQKAVNKPIMVHVGNFPPDLDFVLKSLDKGDIVTHSFNGKQNGLVQNGLIREQALDARKRGVLFDVGHGSASFDFIVAKEAFKLAFKADTASTDIYTKNVVGPVYSLAHTMSKLLNIGYTLDECIKLNTNNVSNALNLCDMGYIKEGYIADLTIFREIIRESTIQDSDGNELKLHKQIVPSAVIIDGVWMKSRYGDAEHIQ